eukprot:324844_1
MKSMETRFNVNWFHQLISDLPIRSWSRDDIDCLIASSISGAAATASGHPADSLKVRMQMASETNQSVFRTMYTIIKQEGIMPFYRGVFPPSAVKSFTTAIFFTTNNYLKEIIIMYKRNRHIERNEPIPNKIILSLLETFCVAGICGFMLFPFISTGELIKIQLQNDKNIDVTGKPREYKNMFDCTQKIVKYKQLHRGMIATAMRLIPGWGIYLFVYDAFNRHFDKQAVLGANETLSSFSVTGRVLVSGTIAGWSCWVVAYPFDYIKTQIQAHPITRWNYVHTEIHITQPPRIRDIVGRTFQKYGFKGFYRGLLPCLIRSLPVNMTNFWVYETVFQMRKSRRNMS